MNRWWWGAFATFVAVWIAFFSYVAGRGIAVPGTTAFWTLAAQPAATLIAAMATLFVGLVALYGTIFTSQRLEKHNTTSRNDAVRSGELERCWDRFTWLVDQSTASDGTSSELFPPEVVTAVVDSLAADARRLDDKSLIAALSEYQQVIALQFVNPGD